jgi:hypothetical protein
MGMRSAFKTVAEVREITMIFVKALQLINSVTIVEEFNDSRIRIRSQENQGVSAPGNCGINKSRYNWIALLDSYD